MGTLETSLFCILSTAATLFLIYGGFLALLTIPCLQRHAVYLHRFKKDWGYNFDVPEQWGFMRNQVTPFSLTTSDGEILYAWHILPLMSYNDHQQELCQKPFNADITCTYGFKLLRDDPDALLVIYFHGAGGTLCSGYRPASYRAISAASRNVYIIAVDYRGFGRSTGQPTEDGLLTDAITVVDWARTIARIPPFRTVIFGHSIGTAVSLRLLRYLASQPSPIFFAGTILVAPFFNAEALALTYKIGGIIPLLSPLASFARLHAYLRGLIKDKMCNDFNIAEFVQLSGTNREAPPYNIIIIHAEDDWDISWAHSEDLFKCAVNAAIEGDGSRRTSDKGKEERTHRGAQGWTVEWKGDKGVIRQEILRRGLHDKIITYPIVSLAVINAFRHLVR